MTDRILSCVLFLALGGIAVYQAFRNAEPEAKFLRASAIVIAVGLALLGIRWLAYETAPLWLRVVAYGLALLALVLVGVSRARREPNPKGDAAMANLKAAGRASVDMTLSSLKTSHENGEKIG